MREMSIRSLGAKPSLKRAGRSVPPARTAGSFAPSIAETASETVAARTKLNRGTVRKEVATRPAEATSFMFATCSNTNLTFNNDFEYCGVCQSRRYAVRAPVEHWFDAMMAEHRAHD